jgi:hypothetical protein
VSVLLDEEVKGSFVDARGRPVTERVNLGPSLGNNQWQLRRPYDDPRFKMLLDLGSGRRDFVAFSLRELVFPLVNADEEPQVTKEVAIRTDSQAASFPGDWYFYGSLGVQLFFPEAIGLHLAPEIRIRDPAGPRYSIPGINLTVRVAQSLQGTRVRVGGRPFAVMVETDRDTKNFVYLTAFVPLALAVGGVLLLFFGSRTSGFATLGLPLALGMLAALPIRQITVPSGLAAPTRVDLILGLGVVASACVFAFALAQHLLNARRSAEPR